MQKRPKKLVHFTRYLLISLFAILCAACIAGNIGYPVSIYATANIDPTNTQTTDSETNTIHDKAPPPPPPPPPPNTPTSPATPPPGTPGGSPKTDTPGGSSGTSTAPPTVPGHLRDSVNVTRTADGRLVITPTGKLPAQAGAQSWVLNAATTRIGDHRVILAPVYYPSGSAASAASGVITTTFPTPPGTADVKVVGTLINNGLQPVFEGNAVSPGQLTETLGDLLTAGEIDSRSSGIDQKSFIVQASGEQSTLFLWVRVQGGSPDDFKTLLGKATSDPTYFTKTGRIPSNLTSSPCVSKVSVVPGKSVDVEADKLCPDGVAFKSDVIGRFSRVWADWGTDQNPATGQPAEHNGTLVVNDRHSSFRYSPAPGVEGKQEDLAIKVVNPDITSSASTPSTPGTPPPPADPKTPPNQVESQPLTGINPESKGLGGVLSMNPPGYHFGLTIQIKARPKCSVEALMEAIKSAGGHIVAGEAVFPRGTTSVEVATTTICSDPDRDPTIISDKQTELTFETGSGSTRESVWVGRNDDRETVLRLSFPDDRFFVGEGNLSLVATDSDDLHSKPIGISIRVEDRGPRCHSQLERGVHPGKPLVFQVEDLCPISAKENVVFQPVEKTEGTHDDDPGFPFATKVGETTLEREKTQVVYTLDRTHSLSDQTDEFFVQAIDQKTGERSRPIHIIARQKRPPTCDITRLRGYAPAPIFSLTSGAFSTGSIIVHRDALVRSDELETVLFNGLTTPSTNDLCVSDTPGEKITMKVIDPTTGNVLDEGLFDRPAGYLYVSSLGVVYYPKRTNTGTDTFTLVAQDQDGLQTRIVIPIEIRDIKPVCEDQILALTPSSDGSTLEGETTVHCQPRTKELAPLAPLIIHLGQSAIPDHTISIVSEKPNETTLKYSVPVSSYPANEDQRVIPFNATIGTATSQQANITITRPETP